MNPSYLPFSMPLLLSRGKILAAAIFFTLESVCRLPASCAFSACIVQQYCFFDGMKMMFPFCSKLFPLSIDFGASVFFSGQKRWFIFFFFSLFPFLLSFGVVYNLDIHDLVDIFWLLFLSSISFVIFFFSCL
jgi:hypothetical protein